MFKSTTILLLCLCLLSSSCGLRRAPVTRLQMSTEFSGLSEEQQKIRIKQIKDQIEQRRRQVEDVQYNMDLGVVIGIFGMGIGALLVFIPEIPFRIMANREIRRLDKKSAELDKEEIRLVEQIKINQAKATPVNVNP